MGTEKGQNRKCYEQFCPMATALDVVGDRWTILIIRELLGGAARFNELQEGLQGIAKNLLSERLRRMEADGIVRRVGTQNVSRYALTERGAAARTAVEELAFWGSMFEPVAPPKHPRSIRAIAMALQAVLARAGDELPDSHLLVELDVEGQHIEVALGERPTATARTTTDADARIRVSRATMSDFLRGGSIDAESFALVSGDESARAALLAAIGIAG